MVSNHRFMVPSRFGRKWIVKNDKHQRIRIVKRNWPHADVQIWLPNADSHLCWTCIGASWVQVWASTIPTCQLIIRILAAQEIESNLLRKRLKILCNNPILVMCAAYVVIMIVHNSIIYNYKLPTNSKSNQITTSWKYYCWSKLFHFR